MDYVEAMERILQSGSGVTTNAMGMDYLRRLVTVARSSGAHLTIVGGFSYECMIELATLGGKNVSFDLAKYSA